MMAPTIITANEKVILVPLFLHTRRYDRIDRPLRFSNERTP